MEKDILRSLNMNHRFRRLIETTIPMIILNGLTVLGLTLLLSWIWGFVFIFTYAAVDIILLRKPIEQSEDREQKVKGASQWD